MRPALTRKLSALTLVAFSVTATPALAQGKGGKGKGGAATAAPEDPKLTEAKKHMEAGAAFYNDPSGHKCEEAYREFKKAHELSGSMNALKGMGLCSMELERDGEAIAHLERFLEAKGHALAPADKAQLGADLKALKAAVAWVTINVDRPDVTITDTRTPARGFPITNRYVPSVTGTKLGIHPGLHEFRASVEGEPDQVWKVEIGNGGTYAHDFAFEKGKPVTAEGVAAEDLSGDKKEPTPSRPVPTSVWVTGGLTLAAAGGGAIAGGIALNKKSAYDKANGTKPRAELEDMRKSVATTNLVADVCFGVAAAGLVTTVVLFAVRPTKQAQLRKDETALRVAPMMLGGGGGGALITGTF